MSTEIETAAFTYLSSFRPRSAIPGMLSDMRCFFHFAFHVRDLTIARQFYGEVLGCREGRCTDTWVDFDWYGHQLSLHLGEPFPTSLTGKVGEHWVPMPHFGIILDLPTWHKVAERLTTMRVAFVVPPHVRFQGQTGEQWTMFFNDPFGNPIEIKGFETAGLLFAT